MSTWFAAKKQHDELDFAHLQSFQKNWYRAEKIIFSFLSLLVVAAAFGFVGDDVKGTHTVLSDDQSIRVTFTQSGRFSALSKLGIDELKPVDRPELNVLLDNTLLQSVEVEKVNPRPLSVTVNHEGALYTFDAAQNLGGHIEFSVRNQKVGPSFGSISVQTICFAVHRFIWP